MKSSSSPPVAASTFITPEMKAMSPPMFTGKNASAILVPNMALSALDGTQ